MNKYNDYPIEECAATVEAKAREFPGQITIYQKWTCQHCGARITMNEPNKFFRSGHCEDCGNHTLIAKCNYMLLASMGK